MALKETWRPRIDGVDDADSSAVNEIAAAVIEAEKRLDDGDENKIDKNSIVQEPGNSTTAVMSQKATVDFVREENSAFVRASKNKVDGSAMVLTDVENNSTVKLSIKGINFLNPTIFNGGSANGVTLTIDGDGLFTLNGTATTGFSFYAAYEKVFDDTITTAVSDVSGSTSKLIHCTVDNADNKWCEANILPDGTTSNTTEMIGEIRGYYIWIDEGTVLENLSFKWQVEIGSTVTPRESLVYADTVVTVSTCGKNLLNNKSFGSKIANGVAIMTEDDGSFTLIGEATKGFSFGGSFPGKINGNATVSTKVVSGSISKTIYPTIEESGGGNITANIQPSGVGSKYSGYIGGLTNAYIWIDAGTVFDSLRFTWQIELGLNTTDHEAYKEGETVTTTAGEGAMLDSISPNMSILTSNDGVVMRAEYNKDIYSLDAQKNVYKYGLPVLRLYGDTSAMDKDNAVGLSYKYGWEKGICTVKWQGSSSLYHPKKNYTIKFDNGFEAKAGWGVQKKYCAKANWIDACHARNVVSAKLWGQIVKSRANANEALNALPNGGAVDGFPVIITINDNFEGLYTFNIPKDGWMFGMGNGTSEAILCADKHSAANNFGAPVGSLEDGDFELEYATNEDDTDWVVPSLNRVINACIASDGTDLDEIGQYLDWDSVIDYYIFTCLIKGIDMTDKNYLLSTFDGIKWFFSAYDLDSTWGLQTDGSEILPANSGVSFQYYSSHRAMRLVYNHKRAELIARYRELRNSVLSEDNVATVFGNFIGSIPKEVFSAEQQRWVKAPLTSINDLHQITDWYSRRVKVMDAEINALE